jgi:uncharacterized flavoprotein (TIGR03862 family)
MSQIPSIASIRTAAVIGGGPAGLIAAETLARHGHHVTVYERMPSLGRKFLLAGRGGLNLTHTEDLPQFLARYGGAEKHLRAAIEAFPPERLRAFSEELEQPTFVGTSGRVFPKAMKASPLLRAWLRRLDAIGVRFALRHRWRGWDGDNALVFDTPDGEVKVAADATVLALGGASWPRMGSDGGWVEILRQQGIDVSDLRSANCGFLADWSEHLRQYEGQPLKRVALTADGVSTRSEAMLTLTGLEGGGVYALSPQLRDAIEKTGEAILTVDLLPDMTAEEAAKRIGVPRGKQSLSSRLRKSVSLSPVAIALAQESMQGKLATLTPGVMAAKLKALPVQLTGVAPIARAISSAGGVTFDELDSHYMVKRNPGLFVAGEMLDWEAPTGGYLLQACFATGVAAGDGASRWLAENAKETA